MEIKLSICSILTLIFVVLKLTGVINWGWVWVIFPIFVPLLIGIFFLILGFILKKIFNL